jgi:hypothetical protein
MKGKLNDTLNLGGPRWVVKNQSKISGFMLRCLGSRNAEMNQRQIIIRIETQRPTIEKPRRHHPPPIHFNVEKLRRRRTGPWGMPTEKPFALPNDWFDLLRGDPAFLKHFTRSVVWAPFRPRHWTDNPEHIFTHIPTQR